MIGQTDVRLLKLELTPFTSGALKSQRIEVLVNGKTIYKNSISIARGIENSINIKLPAKDKLNKYVVDFKFPDAISPKDIGYNEDRRKLAFNFQNITFE